MLLKRKFEELTWFGKAVRLLGVVLMSPLVFAITIPVTAFFNAIHLWRSLTVKNYDRNAPSSTIFGNRL